MGAPILISFAIISLLLAAAIEVLAQQSSANGGLALSPSIQEIPRPAVLASKYVPVVVATLYGIVWAWVDQDVKRMQPWFELSRPGGARARKSLFLSYPHDFIVFLPWRAAKRRHWGVLLSSTMTIIILFLLTPLQPTITGIDPVSHTEPVNIATRSLIGTPLGLTGGNFLSEAFMINNFDQPFSPFITRNFALLPFYVDPEVARRSRDANVTTTTTKFTTELTCRQPEILTGSASSAGQDGRDGPVMLSFQRNSSNYYNISDGHGCMIKIRTLTDKESPYDVSYMYDTPSSGRIWTPDPRFDKPDCGTRPGRPLALVWEKFVSQNDSMKTHRNITARLCDINYYQQEHEVTITAGDSRLHLDSLQPVSPRRPMANFSEDYFEAMIQQFRGALYRTTSEDITAIEVPRVLSEPIDGLRSTCDGHQCRVSGVVKFVFTGQNLSVADISHPDKLVHEFSRARNFLFSMAVHHTIVNQTEDSNEYSASAAFPMTGIVVSRVMSALVEALFILSAISALVLLWICKKSPCRLESNPNSISRLCRLCHDSRGAIRPFQGLDMADEKALKRALGKERFRLSQRGNELYLERIVEADSVSVSDETAEVEASVDKDQRPFEMTRKAGVVFLIVLLGAIIAIVCTKVTEVRKRGIQRPFSNNEITRILERYLPVIYGTIAYSFWLILNRDLCTLQPFRDLCAGNAPPSRSIATTYSAIPPSLTLWRAFKARHWVLTMLCSVALLGRLLGISLGTLFNENRGIVAYPQHFEPLTASGFNDQSLVDFHRLNQGYTPTYDIYHLYANVTTGTPLPPWASIDYFFQPHNLARDGPVSSDATYQLTTRGFGVNANCTSLYQLPAPEPEDNSTCPTAINVAANQLQSYIKSVNPGQTRVSPCSLEVLAPSSLNDTGVCPFDFVLSWARARLYCATRVVHGRAEPSATAIYCKPFFETALFNISVDSAGNVASYAKTSETESTLGYPDFDRHARLLLRYALPFPRNYSSMRKWQKNNWHSDVHAADWISLLISETMGSRDFLDPLSPPPNTFELIPIVQQLYRKGFAILLGRHHDLFNQAEATTRSAGNSPVTGFKLVTETRIFFDETSLIITLTILSIDILVAIILYTRPTLRILPRMPTSIASTIAYVASSHLVHSPEGPSESDSFSFGRYVGLDGKSHVGIERASRVTLIKPSSDAKGSLLSKVRGFRRRRRSMTPGEQGPEYTA
ncbi:hypothetical protein CDD80_2767 [Ophiocordyceps camponoti-rufipedis]|uniref:Uncharacterized protein n=1 Tax=Ophiocordyceps camponoti-rufipedis TaxID=2004952 RepID=A0A2C5YZ84_9HYPO|nr:hypothetical protein CDD80_2767 [Ophiocordyceps camponoti-rufipedis]